ncbi:hypothetical protein KPH14_001321 [Odynerus spinipes]|uniref:CCHC-type domain-containing protein n=1 Tax=Odynerus spinipes TaxID=1348599 RepID=A0AAD9VKM2_9HYME|nr:hypothetical protein KPH14_001321 [Odynerus spinipes]
MEINTSSDTNTPSFSQPQSQQLEQITNSYASATKNSIFPSKHQAIIIDAVDGSTMKDYVQTIANITGTNAIRFASRIFNGRICIYLDSINTAKNMVTNHSKLIINNTYTTVRPLLNPAQRIILSNVSPTIPHDHIENFFKENNIRLTSKMAFIRAGIQDAGFTHVMSFRRQIFINPEDTSKLPDSFLITHDETQYRIFVSSDKVSCFVCKQEGHVANQCPTNTKPTLLNNDNAEPLVTNNSTDQTKKVINNDISNTENQVESEQQISINPNTNNNTNKRAYSTSTEATSPTITEHLSIQDTNIATPKTDMLLPKTKLVKRRKTLKINNISLMLEPAKVKISDSESNYPLNLIQLNSFLENSFGTKNTVEVALEYT